MAALILDGIAGIFLLIAIVFVVKFYIDNNKSKKSSSNDNKSEITVEEGKKPSFAEKPKKDLIIALVFMFFCEAFILIAKHI